MAITDDDDRPLRLTSLGQLVIERIHEVDRELERYLVSLEKGAEEIGMSPAFLVENLLRWVKEGRMLDIKLRREDLVAMKEQYRADRESWMPPMHDEDDGA